MSSHTAIVTLAAFGAAQLPFADAASMRMRHTSALSVREALVDRLIQGPDPDKVNGSDEWYTCIHNEMHTCGEHCCCDAGTELKEEYPGWCYAPSDVPIEGSENWWFCWHGEMHTCGDSCCCDPNFAYDTEGEECIKSKPEPIKCPPGAPGCDKGENATDADSDKKSEGSKDSGKADGESDGTANGTADGGKADGESDGKAANGTADGETGGKADGEADDKANKTTEDAESKDAAKKDEEEVMNTTTALPAEKPVVDGIRPTTKAPIKPPEETTTKAPVKVPAKDVAAKLPFLQVSKTGERAAVF